MIPKHVQVDAGRCAGSYDSQACAANATWLRGLEHHADSVVMCVVMWLT